jgi:CRISPR/Cas system-associated exonuclease Cas4 (RecB family)
MSECKTIHDIYLMTVYDVRYEESGSGCVAHHGEVQIRLAFQSEGEAREWAKRNQKTVQSIIRINFHKDEEALKVRESQAKKRKLELEQQAKAKLSKEEYDALMESSKK